MRSEDERLLSVSAGRRAARHGFQMIISTTPMAVTRYQDEDAANA